MPFRVSETGRIRPAIRIALLLSAALFVCSIQTWAQPVAKADWSKVIRENRTNLQIQDCPEPPLLHKSPIHEKIYSALRDLKADYNRFQPWFPYPRLGVYELEPPSDGKTHWDFILPDELLGGFMDASAGHPVVVNLGPIPQWMVKTAKPVTYPDDPDAIEWNYNQGTELRDPTGREVAEYYARVANWYIRGGFTDERGVRHDSEHHYRFAFWEVLNEVEGEHQFSPETYTRIYDRVVEEVRKVDPEMKFSGPALMSPAESASYVPYFLDAANHRPGIAVGALSFHFYSQPADDEPQSGWQFSVMQQADKALTAARYITAFRDRLSPKTELHFNEIGSMLPGGQEPKLRAPIPDLHWHLSAAMHAYMFIQLARMGVEVVSSAELIDYPGQFAAITLVDWDSGKPNPRYWALRLLHDEIHPGDRLVSTTEPDGSVAAQGFLSKTGNKKLLLVNKRDRQFTVSVPGARGGALRVAGTAQGWSPAEESKLTGDSVLLDPFAVAVVTLPE
jgi:hypothetical protein